jgi:hypothetical protein
MSSSKEPLRSELDWVALAAAAVIVIGWFGLSTFVTQFPGVALRFRFYHLWSVLGNPSRLVTGLGDADSVRGFLFGGLCLVVALTVIVPYLVKQRGAWLAYLAPLALMVICGALLYAKTAGNLLADPGRSGLQSQVIAFANKLANRMSDSVAQHITIGLGAYVSFAASLFLAARGLLRFRAPASGFAAE